MIILSYQVGTTNRPYFYRIWVSHPLPLAKVSFFLTDSISARVFSELVIDIHKRFFASCSGCSLVSRKNNDFFRKWPVT